MIVGQKFGAESEVFRDPDQILFQGQNGIQGFTVRGREDDPEYDNVWFVLALPKKFNTNIIVANGHPGYKEPQTVYLVCEVEYLVRLREAVLPGIYALARSCTVQ